MRGNAAYRRGARACFVGMAMLVLVMSRLDAQSTQRPALLGIEGGFATTWSAASLAVFEGSTACGAFDGGSGEERSIGVRGWLPELFGDGLGLGSRLWAGLSSESFSATPFDVQLVRDPNGSGTIVLDRRYALELASTTIGLDVEGTARPFDRFSVALGGWLEYRPSITIDQRETIEGPQEIGFDDGSRDRPLFGARALTPRRFGYGAIAGASYTMKLSEKMLLVPRISARASFGSPVAEESWTRWSAMGSISLMFDLSSPQSTPPDPPPPLANGSTNERPRPVLRASIDLYGVGADERPSEISYVAVRETLHRQLAPLLPVLYFDSASSDIPPRYHLLSDAAPAGFTLDSSTRIDPMSINHHALNVIGGRIRATPGASIVLSGSTDGSEPSRLARERESNVRGYLRSIWGIDDARIRSATNRGRARRASERTSDGRAENRSVTIASSTPSILAPVASEHLRREFDPPTIGLRPSIVAGAGVKRWTIVVRYEEHELARYTSESSRRDGLMWKIEAERIRDTLLPLVAEMTVEDSSGAIVTSRDTMPLRLASARARRDEQLTREIVGLAFDSEELTSAGRSEIEELAATIRDRARVRITGFADRIGERERNDRLSTARAERVAHALRDALRRADVDGVDITVSGAGTTVDRFDNDLPEGRALTRGAVVVVENP